MTTYRGRTGPNFSQFLNNLNTIQPYENELVPADDLNLDQDLAMFTNTDFTDFDNMSGMPNNNEINFDFNNEQNHPVDNRSDIKYEELLSSNSHPFLANFGTPIQPAHQQPSFQPQSGVVSPVESAASPGSVKLPMKRKQDASPLSIEEQTRLAAEEDKRRRNTAASARFRVKKKQREQALEKTVKEVSDKNATLQAKLDQLEMENKWLKNLVMEKNGSKTEKEITDMYQKFRRESEECESKGTERKDGVGTK